MRLAKLTVLLVLSATVLSAVTKGRQKATIIGRIVAFRPIDRIAQAAPFARNKQLYLFEIEDQKKEKNPTIVKIDYGFIGSSEITDRILQEALPLKMSVMRSTGCDQSYSEFLSSVPSLKDEKSGREIERGIAFVKKFRDVELEPDLPLKCYKLEKGGIQILGGK
jgi:hypothetical protein